MTREPVPVTTIRPPDGWLDLDLRELWDHRELLYFLIWRDLKVRYRQTVLGAAWAIIQPLFTMVVFTVVFGRLAGLPSEGVPYPIFTFAALLPWLALRELPAACFAAVVALAFALGVRVCDWAARTLKIADPSAVVWDEFVGQWIALAPLVLWPRGWGWIAAGFVLFRLFDIAKPWPVSWADRKVGGGFGVMIDDVVAGAYAALALVALEQLVHAFA